MTTALIIRGPEGRHLDEHVAATLRERREELLRHLTLAQQRARHYEPIPAAPRSEEIPLSAAQQRLWFLESYAGGSTGAYHIPTLLCLKGLLDIDALRRSLTELARRHDILRVVFRESNGVARQVVCPAGPVELPVIDLTAGQISAALQQEAATPFDLQHDLPWRARLWRISATEHHLLLLQHHLVSDGRSIELYVRELIALYADARDRRPFAYPEPRLQYADYVAWRQDRIDAALAETQLAWWRETLSGCEPLALTTDGPRHGEPTFGGQQFHARIPAATTRAVEALARDRRTTVFSVLLTAFQTLLHFWSGQDDVTIVTGVSGRDHPDLADLPGFFVNLLPVRTRFDARSSFADMLERVTRTLHEALANQDVPLAQLLRVAGVPADGASNPLLRVMLVMQSATGIMAPSLPGLDVAVTPEADQAIAKFELTLSLQPVGDELDMRIEYRTDLFRAETISCLAEQFVRVLDRVTQKPTAQPHAASLLGSDDFQRFVLAANGTGTPYPRDVGLAALFAAQVDRAPDTLAIVDGDRMLSYLELDQAAERVARRLRPHLRPGRGGFPAVAVCMDRRLELAVALLATVKAGAAYVPLDPQYPEQRLRYILDEVDAVATLACGLDQAVQDILGRIGPPVLSLDRFADADLDTPVAFQADSAVPAYVCFTSGTTGSPKGAVIEQHAVARLVLNADYVRFGPGMRVGLVSNPAFDAITFEFWGALLNGGTLFAFPRHVLLDAELFAAQLHRDRIETIFLTTALFDAFAHQQPGMFRGLQYLVVGGSALTPATIAAVLGCSQGRPRHLVNGYGPTENTTFSVCREIVADDATRRAIPIGRPISNSTAYVLDSQERPLPPCIPGELHVGGEGLARCYLNQTALTQERFVDVKLSHPEGARAVATRVYRTGDIVRWLPDGTLDYLGRRDRQVKVNGFRIELGEIEARIAAHPDVAQCAVRTIDEDGHNRLIAWYVARDRADLPEAALRQWLEATLPLYMVPPLLLRRPLLPTTSGGKIDLEALTLPERAAPRSAVPTLGTRVPAGPAVGTIATLLTIWRDVLRIDAIDLDDDFFVIGGDSILSIQVVARARECGFALAPRMIFEHRTLRRITDAVEAAVPAPARTSRRGKPTLTPIQRWFFELGLAVPAHFNQAFLLVPPMPIQRHALVRAMTMLVRHHPVLSTRFRRDSAGEWQPAGQSSATPPVFQTQMSPGAQDADLQSTLTLWQSGFSLQEGRLVAAGLVDGLVGSSQRLFLAVHHLVVDIVSWRVLFDDLFRLLADPEQSLAPPASAFSEWSLALAEFAAGPALTARDHWLHFAGSADAPAVTGPVTTIIARLDARTTDDLLRRSGHGVGARPHELLLAAVAHALALHGQPGAAIWLEGHGREDVVGLDVSRTVGWFTSRFPFRLPEPAGDTDMALEDLLVATKEALRGVPHQGLGFGALRAFAPDQATRQALGCVNVAPVIFNYLGQFDAMLGDGWRIAPEQPGAMVAERNLPVAALDIAALVVDGCLELRLSGADGIVSARPARPLRNIFHNGRPQAHRLGRAAADGAADAIGFSRRGPHRKRTRADIRHSLDPSGRDLAPDAAAGGLVVPCPAQPGFRPVHRAVRVVTRWPGRDRTAAPCVV